MPSKQDQRTNYPRLEEELYALPDIKEFIEKERRQDELERLREAEEQEVVWKRAVAFCLIWTVLLIALAISGIVRP